MFLLSFLFLVLISSLHATTTPPSHPTTAALQPRIVGGAALTSLDTLPFIGSMLIRHSAVQDWKFDGCGGAILYPTKIVTAAHCVRKLKSPAKTPIAFRVGSLRHDGDGGGGGVLAHVKRWDMHPKYDRPWTDFDVAMITLIAPLPFSDTIQAIPLVAANTHPAPGQILEVAGWGATCEGEGEGESSRGRASAVLHHALVQAIDRAACARLYRGAPGRRVTDRMACTTGKGQDSCWGDSGGPVVDYETRELVGLVSWARDCANPRWPSVNADLAHPGINGWIREQMLEI